MASLKIADQVTMIEYLQSEKDTLIENWGRWRDAQGSDDAHRALVDEVYNEYMRTLDKLIETLLPF